MKHLLFLILTLLISLTSCKKESINYKIKTDPTLAEDLRSSPEILSIGNNNFILTTYLQRDFFPPTEENGRKMNCINKLTEMDGKNIPNTLKLKKQYVINGSQIWIAKYNEIRENVNFIKEGLVRNGPKWGPHIEVDVVCEFENLGITYRIIAKSQIIGRTD